MLCLRYCLYIRVTLLAFKTDGNTRQSKYSYYYGIILSKEEMRPCDGYKLISVDKVHILTIVSAA